MSAEDSKGSRRAFLAFLAFGLVMAGLAFGLEHAGFLDLATLEEAALRWAVLVDEAPLQTALIYLLIYLIWVNLFIPDSILSIAGGLLFGAALGTPLIILGTTLASVIQFALARGALRPYFLSKLGPGRARWGQAFEDRGFSVALSLRLIPGAPTSLQNLAPALFGCPLMPFAAATALGLIPIKYLLASFGEALGQAVTQEDLSLGDVLTCGRLLALLSLAVLALIPALKKRSRKRQQQAWKEMEDQKLEQEEQARRNSNADNHNGQERSDNNEYRRAEDGEAHVETE